MDANIIHAQDKPSLNYDGSQLGITKIWYSVKCRQMIRFRLFHAKILHIYSIVLRKLSMIYIEDYLYSIKRILMLKTNSMKKRNIFREL